MTRLDEKGAGVMFKRSVRTFSALVFVLVAGCSQPELPKDNYYRLQVTRPDAPLPKPVIKGVVEVERFVADGLTAGRPIVYSDSSKPLELRAYHYHFWTEPPVIMLRDQLVDYMRHSNIADLVVTPDMRKTPDYILTARIKRLEKVIDATPKGIVEVELSLKKELSGDIVHLANYRIEVGARSKSVSEAVVAMNRALSDIYDKFVGNLKKL